MDLREDKRKRFRRHTKEERKREKLRYKDRLREEKRKKKAERTISKRPAGCTVAVQTEDAEHDPTSREQIKSKSAMPMGDQSRAGRMVRASKEKAKVPATASTGMKRPVPQAVPATKPKVVKQRRTCISDLPIVRIKDLANPQNGKHISVGEGSYGTCELKMYRGNIPVVVKTYMQNVPKDEVVGEAIAIFSLQRPYHHPCLPFLFGVHIRDKPYFLVTQFFGKDQTSHTIASAIEASILKTASEWFAFLDKLVQAVVFVHSKGWLHNDIKRDNIVLHSTEDGWQPVLVDFGKSRVLKDAEYRTKTKRDLPWIAPEVLNGEATQSTKSDIFSLGYLFKCIASQVSLCKIEWFIALYRLCMKSRPEQRPSLSCISKELSQGHAKSN